MPKKQPMRALENDRRSLLERVYHNTIFKTKMTPKETLWIASNHNLYFIVMAAANIGLMIPADDYAPVLAEVIRMKSTRIEGGTQYRRMVPIKAPRFERVQDDIGESFLIDQPELV